jgi:protein TonB
MAGILSLDLEAQSHLSRSGLAPASRSRSALTTTVSVAAHAVVLGALVAVPLLTDGGLPEPAGEVRAFFAPPVQSAPPPPPPAAAAAPTLHVEATRRSLAADALTPPIEIPAEIRPEGGIELGVEAGVVGGVEGGVPGGVVGGVVGGLPEAPPPPLRPLRVGDAVKEPRKIVDVPPVYPALAVSSRIEGVVILECVVDAGGHVQEARVLRGVPLLDQAALDAVRRWAYSTTLVDGVPVPVIMTVTVTFRLS